MNRWTCFVCGERCEDYQQYREHITSSHEEGREYISCPDCNAPVRDLVSHYKVKHPKRKLPKGVQTRVTVWKVFHKGQPVNRKPVVRSGEMQSKKNGKLIKYRSGLEEQFFNLLEEDVDVVSYDVETYRVPYLWNGKWRHYVPDVRVNYVDGSVEIWEIKPASQTDYEQNKAKWTAAKKWAEQNGWQFIIQTEVALNKLKRKINLQKANLNEGK